MPRTLLPDQVPTSGGIVPAYTAAGADGHAFNLNPGTVLEVETGATGTTMTVVSPGSTDAGDLPDKAVAIPANQRRRFNFRGALATYRQEDGTAHINFSSVATVTLAVIQAG